MAAAVAPGSAKASSWIQLKNSSKKAGNNAAQNKKILISCVSSSVRNPYRTLRIHPGASESEVKKAFRQLALQYHPDVCKGINCSVKFHEINEAYDTVMTNLREEIERGVAEEHSYDEGTDDSFRGMFDPDWDL